MTLSDVNSTNIIIGLSVTHQEPEQKTDHYNLIYLKIMINYFKINIITDCLHLLIKGTLQQQLQNDIPQLKTIYGN